MPFPEPFHHGYIPVTEAESFDGGKPFKHALLVLRVLNATSVLRCSGMLWIQKRKQFPSLRTLKVGCGNGFNLLPRDVGSHGLRWAFGGIGCEWLHSVMVPQNVAIHGSSFSFICAVVRRGSGCVPR